MIKMSLAKIGNPSFVYVLIIVASIYFSLSSSGISRNYIFAYGQVQDSPFQAQVRTIDNMTAQKIKVGDIDIAYKQLGNSSNTSQPIVLIAGGGMTMDMWNPTLLEALSSNQPVIIFDNRGAGNSTIGTSEYSITQLANDTADLLNVLKISSADILGYSMGSFIAQELALMYPDKVNKLVLYASSCSSKESIPPSPEVMQAFSDIANSSSPIQEEKLVSLLFPPDWLSANPEYQNYMPIPKESVSPQVLQAQFKAIENWTGTCDDLSNITQPTLIIVGTEDIFTPAGNSLMIVEKIPSAWLIQIKDAGHGLMNQYPDKFNRIVSTFLETIR
jgi:pimeloyl-ACP methyl ester carboxylesterase